MFGLPVLLLSVVGSLAIGGLVFSQGVRDAKNQIYLAATLCFVLLALANYLSLTPSELQPAYVRTVMATTTVGLFLVLGICYALFGKYFSKKVFASLGFLTLVTAVLDFTPIIFSDITTGSPASPVPGTGVAIFLAHFLLVGFATLYILFSELRHAKKGSSRSQARSILVGIIPIIFIAPITGFVFLLAFGIDEFIVLTPLYTLFFVSSVGYAIVRHGLFDVRRTVVRTIAYVLSLAVLAVIYYLLAYVVSITLFQGQTSETVSLSPINIFLALLLAFIFQPIKHFFDQTTDNIFFRDLYHSDEFYARLSEVLTTTTDLRGLLEKAASEIGTTMKAEQAFFFMQYDGNHHIAAGTRQHKNVPQSDIDVLNNHIEANDTAVIVTELLGDSHDLRRLLVSHKIALLMPLAHHGDIIGYFALGEQKSTGYSNRDIKVLKTISDELIIAIQNALSVQAVKTINANLEQRIEAATAELRTSNARLKRLDASKDEFLSMASHQLRTPLTSVKGYLSMMIDGDVGNISATQKQVLEEAFSSSERMVHLIHDFLNVSRLQTGKFMLELSDVNLVQLVQDEVKSLEKVAASHSMKLAFINNAGDLAMQLDDTKVRQVVMNYIDNAIYYSRPNSTIHVELSRTDDAVTLRVVDTGIGVPKAEQEHLFGKFFRATNARKQRPDGTGVGIFLAKKVITALGGEIVFASKEGKGSTFGFTLPLERDDALLENNTDQARDNK